MRLGPVEDADGDDESVAIVHKIQSAADPAYDALADITVTVKVDDDEVPGLVVHPASVHMIEGGGPQTYTVKLGSRPADTVTVRVTSADEKAVTVEEEVARGMIFPPEQWSQAKTVQLQPVNDEDTNNELVDIVNVASSLDPAYQNRSQTVLAYVLEGEPPALALHVAAITDDDTINLAEKAEGFTISGDTGAVDGAAVSVSVGSGTPLTTASAKAQGAQGQNGLALWSVSVPAKAPYITGTSVAVVVTAAGTVHKAAVPVSRTLGVDLAAPAVRYTALTSLQVGEAITRMSPETSDKDIASYSAVSLPAGLSIDGATGAISGAPVAANADAVTAAVTVTDQAGNSAAVSIIFPAVARGEQSLDDFTVPLESTPLLLRVDKVTGDDTINSVEKGAGFVIEGNTGSVAGVAVKVTIGTQNPLTLTAESVNAQRQNDPAAWSVNVLPDSSHFTDGTDMTVKVEAAKLGYTAAVPVSRTLRVDLAAPAVTFSPVDKAVMTNPASDVTVTFDEAVRKASDGSVFDDAAAVAAVTLVKEGDSTDLAVSNRVTINAEKQVITIDPANSLVSGSRYTVTLLKNHVEDLPGNEIGVDQTAIFTVDADPPAVRYTPPSSLQVGRAITSMRPQTADKDKNSHSYGATSLPDGLSIADASTGEITGTPMTAGAAVTATVKVTDAAGNISRVSIKFPKVDKGEQTLSGFGYGADSQKFDVTPVLAAPTGAALALAYTTTTPEVCSVDETTGELTFLNAGDCTITVTAGGSANYNEGQDSVTVAVQPLGALKLSVAPITGDNTINLAEKASGFMISGETGTVTGVVVKVTIGIKDPPLTLPAESAKALDAKQDAPAIWSVNVPINSVHLTAGAVAVKVEASKAGYTAATAVDRPLTVDLVAPAVRFTPANSAVMTDPSSNVTVTFTEAVRKADGGVFNDAAAVAAVTLIKEGDINNTDLAGTGQVTISGRVITIDPANALVSGSQYTVTLLGDHVEDLPGNQITLAKTATFTVADAPSVTFSPVDGGTAGPNVTVTVTFDKAVRNINNNSAITDSNAHAVVELKKDNTGSDLAVTGRVTISGRVITIDPANALITGSYTVRVLANVVEDHHDNELGTAQTATFTVDAAAPGLGITLAPAAFKAAGATIEATFEFTEVVTDFDPAADIRVSGGTKPGSLTASTDLTKAGKVWTGTFTTSGNSGNLVVTVGANSVQDSVGNLGPANQVSKTATRDTVAPGVTFAPEDNAVMTNPESNVTVSFDEAVLKADGGVFNHAAAAAAVTLVQVGDTNKTDLAVTGRVTISGRVITIDPANSLVSGSQYTVTLLGDHVEDLPGNQITLAKTATFTVADAPSVTFSPVDGGTAGPNVTVTVTFDKAVRNINNNSAITDSNAHAVVELKKDNTGSDLAVTGRVTISGRVITIDPASALITGSYTVRVLANVVEDHHDNPLGTAQTATFTVDAAAPGLGITLAPAAFKAAGAMIEATFEFTEVVTGFDPAADIRVSGGTKPGSLTASTDLTKAGKVWTGTFTTSGNSGNLVVTVGANSVQDSVGNLGPANQVSKTATRDTVAPAVTFAPADNAVMTNPESNVTVSFDEAVLKADGGVFNHAAAAAAVTLVKVGDTNKTDLAVTGRVTISGRVITIDPANALVSGSQYTVTLLGDHVEDLPGNQITLAKTATFTVADAPSVTFSPVDGGTAGPNVTVTVTFDKAVRNINNNSAITDSNAHAVVELKKDNTGSDLAVTGRVTISGRVITIDPASALITGSYTVRVLANVVEDHHDNELGTAQTATFTVDAAAPGLGITLAPAAFKAAGAMIEATFEFTEVVTDFDPADIRVNGGTKPGSLTASTVAGEAGKVWSGTFTTSGNSGNLVVTVPANAVQDSVGNLGPASQVRVSAVRDTTAPGVTISGVPEYLVNTTAFTAAFTFDEAVSGFAQDDVTVSNGALGNLTAVVAAAGTAWSAQVTPDGQGDVTVEVRKDAVTDVAGNTGPAAAVATTAIHDAVAPGLTITLVPAAFNGSGDEIVATFEFTEVVTDFVLADVTVEGGDKPASLAGSTVAAKQGKVYTGTFTTAGNSGDLVVTVGANSALDVAGNTGPANQTSKTATRDTVAPAVTFAPADNAVMTNPASNVTVSFDEAVFKADGGVFDDAAAAAAVTLVQVGDTNNTDLAVTGRVTILGRVITINPANSLVSGSRYTVTLLKNQVEDLPGNEITLDQTATFTVDADAPSVTFSPASGHTVGPNVTVTVTFGEAVRNIVNSSAITNSNAHAVVELKKDNTGSDLAGTGQVTISGQVITITPASPLITGSYTVRVLANLVEDHHDNPLVTAQTATFTVDAAAPGLGITLAPAAFNGSGDKIEATFTFTEAVTDFEVADIRVNGGTKPGSLTASTVAGEAGKVWSGTFTTSGNSGNLVVTVPANSVQDSAGNLGPASQVRVSAVRDTTAPGVTISGVPAYLVNTAAFPAAFTFDEAVSGFAQDDVTVSNGVLGNPAVVTAGTAWSAQVTPDGQGDVTVEVRKDAVTDVAGNPGPAAAVATTAIHDAVAPGLTITLVPAAFNGSGDEIVATFEFTEVVTGFVVGDVTVDGGNKPASLAGSTVAAKQGKVYTGTFTTAGNSGDLVVTVGANSALDVAGNTGPANQVSKTATRDTVAPAVTFAPADNAVMTNPASNVTVSFDEAVRKADGGVFDDAAAAAAVTLVQVGDTNKTDLAVSNRVMIDAEKQVITINPANSLVSGSEYTVTLLGDHVEDLPGNEITLARTATFTVDADAPSVTFSPDGGTVGPNVTVTVTFGEAVRNIINNSAITDSNAHAVVELKKDNTGSDLAGTGQVTISGRVITIDPASALTTGSYTVRVLANVVEDHHDNPLVTAQTATFTVDADPPAVRYTPPPSLKVGVAIMLMRPQTADTDKNSHSYGATSLPDGLSIADASTGEITGTPTAAGAAVTAAVTVTDAAGNSSPVSIKFPKVDKGEQTLSGFSYSASSLKLGATAPMVRPPAGAAARVPLVYATTPASASVCSVNSGTGELTILKVGQCVITATAAGNVNYDGGTISFTVTVQPVDNKIDYDADNDGLIEITKLEQLNAMRWDTDGNAAADVSSNDAAYAAAFPHPVAAAGGGNGALGCSDDSGAAAACTGYELKANLDFNEDASYANASLNKAGWTSGFGWEPIGDGSDAANRFAAVFDGNGHSIANLFINRSGERVGLFGHTDSSARLRNLGLKNIDVTGGASVGALAGRLEGRVERCHASGTVEGAATGRVGGLVGDNRGGSVSASYAAVAVTGIGSNIGGLVGRNKGSVELSFAAGAVNGNNNVGGLVGSQIGRTLKAVYAAGAVAGSGDRVGGLAGNNEGAITAGYATGAVSGSNDVGGLVGKNTGGSAADSYWDTQASGQSSSAQGVGKSTVELQLPAGYKGVYANWNLDLDSDGGGGDNPWDFGASSQYPALKADLNEDGVATVTEFGGGLGHQTLRRGLAVSEAAVTVEEDGGTADYTVVLVSAPAANVVVAPASGDMAAAAVSPPSLTFTPTNWSRAQTVTVTGVDDNIDNAGDVRETTITHTVSSTDTDYDNIAVPPLAVAVADDDAEPLALSVAPATLAEGGSAMDVTVTVSLPAAAGDNLRLPLRFAGSATRNVDYFLSGTESVTISPGASSGSTVLTITPIDDSIDEGLDETIKVGTTHNGNAVAAELLLTDDDDGAPVLSIEMAAGYSGTDAIPVRFVFPEPVTGFTSDDVTVSGGDLGALSTKDWERTYVSTVTPDDPLPNSITVTVRRSAVTDRSGSTGPAAPVVKTAQYDVTAPTLEIEGLPSALHGTEPLVLVFRFSEPVEFGSEDVEVANGRVTDFSGAGAVYKVEVTPDGGAVLRVGVKLGAVADGAGNTVAPIPRTAAPVDGELTLSKHIVRTPGRYLQSLPDQVLPGGMVVQGAEVHYQASLPRNSPLDSNNVEYSYAFVRKQGDVEFPAQDDDGNTAANRFRADWYGENIVEVTARDTAGKKAAVLDKVFVHFASRRILGGAAENLTQTQKDNIFRPEIHDRRAANPGMAFLPDDYSRASTSSPKIVKGFHKVTEPRLLKTSRGTLLIAAHASTINPDIRRGDMMPGQGIVLARSEDHGNTWRSRLLVQDDNHHWGYSAFVEVGTTLYLYVMAGHNEPISWLPRQNFASTGRGPFNTQHRGMYYFTSTDDGRTWSQPIRHNGLSDSLGIPFQDSYSSTSFPKGVAPTTNILKVPNLQLGGRGSSLGYGLLLPTAGDHGGPGYIFASLDGGVNWTELPNPRVRIADEMAWTVLDNNAGDIYMIVRDVFTSYWQHEYVVSREIGSTAGLVFKGSYGTSLKNTPSRISHHWLTTIRSGAQRGRLLYGVPGAYTRHHVDLLVSEPVQGDATVGPNLFGRARVLEGVGWGYSALEYLEADLPSTWGMGKDAVVLMGESEPIHKETHQLIDLKPDRRGGDERFTLTAYLVSWDYVDVLLDAWKNRTAGLLGFEPGEGWASIAWNSYRALTSVTDRHGNRWKDGVHAEIFAGMALFFVPQEQQDLVLARRGQQVLVLGRNTAQAGTLVLDPAGSDGVGTVSFYIKRFAHDMGPIALTVEYHAGTGWQTALDRTYRGGAIPSSYTEVRVSINQDGNVQLRFSVEGAKGFLIDDVSVTPFVAPVAPGR